MEVHLRVEYIHLGYTHCLLVASAHNYILVRTGELMGFDPMGVGRLAAGNPAKAIPLVGRGPRRAIPSGRPRVGSSRI